MKDDWASEPRFEGMFDGVPSSGGCGSSQVQIPVPAFTALGGRLLRLSASSFFLEKWESHGSCLTGLLARYR